MKLMKKVLSIILCFTFIFTVFYFNSSARDENDFTFTTLSNGTIKITKYNGNETEVTIPDTINGYDVTAIDFMAFARCWDVELITIGKNVTSIGNGAFSNCSSLKKIIVSNENNSYSTENDVLFNKSKTEIICYPAQKSDKAYEMPESVEKISMNTFSKCAYLEIVELSENLKTISMYSFVGCEKLDSIYMSSKVEKIEQDAINECSKNLLIYFKGYNEQWNSISIDGSSKIQLDKIVVCKDIDENLTIKLTDKDTELSYSSKVPFELKISDKTIIKVEGTTKENSSGKYEVTAKITPLKSGKTTISAVAENGFVICNFNYTVEECKHRNMHFVKTEKPATCTEDGTEIYGCDDCDHTEQRVVKATGHTFGEWEVDVKATHEKEGIEIRSCNSCGVTDTRTIPKLESSTPKPDKVVKGDVDGNKSVTATDARKILRYVAGLETLSADAIKIADVTGDGKVAATDARRILRHVAGLESL